MSEGDFLFDMNLADALHLEGKERIETVEIRFHTDEFVVIKVTYDDHVTEEVLPVRGIMGIKEALGLPYIARELVITAGQGEWTLAHYHYEFVPTADVIAKVLGVISE